MCGTKCKKWLNCCCHCPLPVWVQIWLLFSTIVCCLDIVFTMTRPESLEATSGWRVAWQLYSDIDLHYNSTTDVITTATGRAMTVEVLLNVVALVLNYIPLSRIAPHAVVVAFLTSAFTFWKTVVYMLMFILPPEGAPSYINNENTLWTILIFWVLDLIWVVLPGLVLVRLWPKLAQSAILDQAEVMQRNNVRDYYKINREDVEF